MDRQICTECGTVGYPVNKTPGSFFIELILWLCFLVPGLIYSVWRLASRKKACSICSGKMVPLNTPMGKRLQGYGI